MSHTQISTRLFCVPEDPGEDLAAQICYFGFYKGGILTLDHSPAFLPPLLVAGSDRSYVPVSMSNIRKDHYPAVKGAPLKLNPGGNNGGCPSESRL